jgi:hypothetical protein
MICGGKLMTLAALFCRWEPVQFGRLRSEKTLVPKAANYYDGIGYYGY